MHQYRTNNCGQLNKSDLNKEVKLSGWVHSKRDHGGVLFIDLRDFFGLTQCLISNENGLDIDEIAHIKLESVITVTGKVIARSEETINKNLPSGEIEIEVQKFEIESAAEQIPFQVNDKSQEYPEDLRLRYRFLDLRREKMQKKYFAALKNDEFHSPAHV